MVHNSTGPRRAREQPQWAVWRLTFMSERAHKSQHGQVISAAATCLNRCSTRVPKFFEFLTADEMLDVTLLAIAIAHVEDALRPAFSINAHDRSTAGRRTLRHSESSDAEWCTVVTVRRVAQRVQITSGGLDACLSASQWLPMATRRVN